MLKFLAKILLVFLILLINYISLFLISPSQKAYAFGCGFAISNPAEGSANNPAQFQLTEVRDGNYYGIEVRRKDTGELTYSTPEPGVRAQGIIMVINVDASAFPAFTSYEIRAYDLSGSLPTECGNRWTYTIEAGSGATIQITGPDGEDQYNLPSRQSDQNIWYNVNITGLEPNKGYHFQFYKLIGYQPGVDGEDGGGNIAGGVKDSVCGGVDNGNKTHNKEAISDNKGNISLKYQDDYIPGDPPTGNFIFEVATSKLTDAGFTNPLDKDCVRDKYVAYTQVRIVDTPENYSPFGVELVPGHNPCDKDIDGDGIIDCETALGNIPTEAGEFAKKVLSIGIGIAGGIALIIMVIGSIRVLTSAGDPKNVAAGREMIIAAVAGLLFLIFSVLILRFIGVEIIGL